MKKGTLKRWQDDRGFGFIQPLDGSKDVFLHISEVKNSTRRPQENDTICYACVKGSDGKLRAINAFIEGAKRSPQSRSVPNRGRSKPNPFQVLGAFLGFAALLYGGLQIAQQQHLFSAAPQGSTVPASKPSTTAAGKPSTAPVPKPSAVSAKRSTVSAPKRSTATPPKRSTTPVPKPSASSLSTGDQQLANAFQTQTSNIQVQGSGTVLKILPDDLEGGKHQKFLVRLASGQTLLIAHNIDIAPRIETLQSGNPISFYGEYEWNAKGGVIHWTHHDPTGSHPNGWLKYGGQTYQ